MAEFTEKFYQDAYAVEIDAEVLSCERAAQGYAVILSDTVFYPEGGGQPADRGVLRWQAAEGGREFRETAVLDVQRLADGRIVHLCREAVPAAHAVHGRIDWARRFDFMQNHSGEHILSGLVHEALGYENVGFHMGELTTIDLSGPMDWAQLMELERRANEAVCANLPVGVSFPNEEALRELPYRSKKELLGQVRIVTIPGVDACACCGMHVARTGEIGVIKCFSLMNYKGGVRIEMACGARALREIERRVDEGLALSRLLAASPGELETAVRRIREESLEKDHRIGELKQRGFEAKAAALPEGRPLALLFEEGLTPVDTRRLCELLLARNRGTVAVVLSRREDGWYYCAGSRSVDMRAGAGKLNRALGGRGGGSREMIQGGWSADEHRIREVLEQEFGGSQKDAAEE